MKDSIIQLITQELNHWFLGYLLLLIPITHFLGFDARPSADLLPSFNPPKPVQISGLILVVRGFSILPTQNPQNRF